MCAALALQVLQKYNQPHRLPPIPDVAGAVKDGGPTLSSSSGIGSAAVDVEALVRHAQLWCQALFSAGGGNPNTQQGRDAQELAQVPGWPSPFFLNVLLTRDP